MSNTIFIYMTLRLHADIWSFTKYHKYKNECSFIFIVFISQNRDYTPGGIKNNAFRFYVSLLFCLI